MGAAHHVVMTGLQRTPHQSLNIWCQSLTCWIIACCCSAVACPSMVNRCLFEWRWQKTDVRAAPLLVRLARKWRRTLILWVLCSSTGAPAVPPHPLLPFGAVTRNTTSRLAVARAGIAQPCLSISTFSGGSPTW